MLTREGMPASNASIGLLRREEFDARRGTLLLWQNAEERCRAVLREFCGHYDEDIAVLLVAEPNAFIDVLDGGWAALPGMIRRGRLSPFILKTMDELEAAGLADFIEELELAEPRH